MFERFCSLKKRLLNFPRTNFKLADNNIFSNSSGLIFNVLALKVRFALSLLAVNIASNCIRSNRPSHLFIIHVGCA